MCEITFFFLPENALQSKALSVWMPSASSSFIYRLGTRTQAQLFSNRNWSYLSLPVFLETRRSLGTGVLFCSTSPLHPAPTPPCNRSLPPSTGRETKQAFKHSGRMKIVPWLFSRYLTGDVQSAIYAVFKQASEQTNKQSHDFFPPGDGAHSKSTHFWKVLVSERQASLPWLRFIFLFLDSL